MSDIIDDTVNEALEADAQMQTQEEIQEPADQDQQEQPEQEEGQEEQDESHQEYEPFPKKAVNALNRRNKTIAKLRAENSGFTSELQQLRAEVEALKNPAPKEPQEDDFDNYGDYLKALATFKGAPEQPQEKPLSREEVLQEAQEQIHYQQRMQHMQTNATQMMQDIPDYQQLHAEYSDVMDDLPEGTVKAFLDADNPAAAFYALAKEGKLENLSMLHPHQAAMEIARAEFRGQQMVEAQKQKVTKAQPPIKGVKESGQSSTNLADQSPDDILKWLES